MRLHCRALPGLPGMSWCACVSMGDESVRLLHGERVDAAPDFFFEGAWNGAFSAGSLACATMIVGSGGWLLDDRVVFTTPSHPLERLHSVAFDDVLVVSNSFALLLAVTGDSVDLSYPHYSRDFLTSLHGLSRAVKTVPTRLGRRARLHYCCKLDVDRKQQIDERPLAAESPFSDYPDYVARLETAFAAIADNAASRERANRFDPITTLSSGYDSPAVSALACRIGCTRAITFRDARENFRVEDDAGDEIAAHLGLDIEHFDRDEYRQRSDLPEAEFVGTGNGGEDVVMCGLERVLAGKLLFTGYRGDTVWARSKADPTPSLDFVQKDPSGASLGEFRRRVGFVHVPVPALTFTRHPSIQAISNSPKMDPWSVAGESRSAGLRARFEAARGLSGAGYDRPIPRRIAEEQGVPRHLFGQRKAAITQPLDGTAGLERFLSPQSLADFQAYCTRHHLPSAPSWQSHRVFRAAARAKSSIKRLAELAGFGDSHRPNRRGKPRREDYLYHWAMERLQRRHESAATAFPDLTVEHEA